MDASQTTEKRLTPDVLSAILWESVWSSVVRSFLIQILGGIAVSFLSEVFSEMAPSLPPGIPLKPEAEGTHGPAVHAVKAFIGQHEFWIIFSVVFGVTVAARLAHFLSHDQPRRFLARLLRVHRRISSQWFGLFVVNAFTAWILSAMFLFLQQFSWTHLVLELTGQVLAPVFHFVGALVPASDFLARWWDWYGANQAKFCFWLFYSAAICDDLGLPNYKACIRWGNRRLRRYARSRLGLQPGAAVPEREGRCG